MAIGALVKGGANNDYSAVVIPSSLKGVWTTAHDDSETAQSATELLYPASIDDSGFHWIEVPHCASRVLVRAVMTKTATVTTSPVVRVVGAYGTVASDGSFATDGTAQFLRLDNVDANAVGVTLTLVSSGASLLQDATYAYSDPPTLEGYDLRGAKYVGILVETAANLSAGTVPVQVLLLN